MKMLMVAILSLAACGVESGADPVIKEQPAVLDLTGTVLTRVNRTPAEASECFQFWDCQSCGIWLRNVLFEVCGDGPATVIFTGPCKQPCSPELALSISHE